MQEQDKQDKTSRPNTSTWSGIVSAQVNDKMTAALESTRALLTRIDVKALDEMRKSFELPPEALGALIEIFTKEISKKDAEYRPERTVLPLNTGNVPVPRNASAVITARPQRVAFRPRRLFVSNHSPEYSGPWWKRISPWYTPPALYGAADWMINDVVIGNRSQFAQTGAIPGDMFATNSIDSFVSWETAQTAMDIKLIVTYIGACPKGSIFYGSLIGEAVI